MFMSVSPFFKWPLTTFGTEIAGNKTAPLDKTKSFIENEIICLRKEKKQFFFFFLTASAEFFWAKNHLRLEHGFSSSDQTLLSFSLLLFLLPSMVS